MPSEYEFDAVRWCRTMAKEHWQRNEFDISSTFRTVAEEIDRLRVENDALRNESRVYRAQCAMRDEWRDKIEAELAALKDAVRPVARGWGMVKKDGDCAVLNCAGSGYRISAEALDALAALVGEE